MLAPAQLIAEALLLLAVLGWAVITTTGYRFLRRKIRAWKATRLRRRNEHADTQPGPTITNFVRPVRRAKSSYQFDLTRIDFTNGNSIKPTRINVLIGPNNSGKSFALKSLYSVLCGGGAPTLISAAAVTEPTTMAEFHASYDLHVDLRPQEIRYKSEKSDLVEANLSPTSTEASKALDSAVDKGLVNDEAHDHIPFLNLYGPLFAAIANTDDRLTYLNTSKRTESSCGLARLYMAGRDAERQLASVTQQHFGVETRLDDAQLSTFSLRVGTGIPAGAFDPLETRQTLQRIATIEEQGDGMRAFTTVASSFVTGERPILLIDEPEAFLHPAQSFALGKLMASAEPQGGHLFIATHSASLVRGLFAGSLPGDLTLLRFQPRAIFSTGSTPAVLDPGYLQVLLRNPLLNSSTFVEGMFYPSVVIFEGHSDRVFFEAAARVANKLRASLLIGALGIPSATMMHIAYRTLGITSTVLFDPDILLSEHFRPLVEKLTNSATLRDQLLRPRKAICASVNDPEEFKKYGRKALSRSAAEHLDNLRSDLRSFGVLLNVSGVLESSLSDYDVNFSNNKREWIENAVEYLDTLAVDYSRSPWTTITEIEDSLEAPQRGAVVL